jgi:hypothetical protein
MAANLTTLARFSIFSAIHAAERGGRSRRRLMAPSGDADVGLSGPVPYAKVRHPQAAGTPHSASIKHYQSFSGVLRGRGFFARPHQG